MPSAEMAADWICRGIDDEGAGEVGVEIGDAEGGWLVAELGEHFVEGPFRDLPPTMGRRRRLLFAGAKFVADLRHGEDWADADQRIAGADEDAVASRMASRTPGAGCADSTPAKRMPFTTGSVRRFTKYS